MVFSDIETPSSSEDEDHQPTAEDRLFNCVRKKSKINKHFTEEDRIREIRKCLSLGSNINAAHTSDKTNCTVLHIAVQKGFKEVVEFLVCNGADTDIRNSDNETPLDIAKKLNNRDIITLLGGQVESENDEARNSSKAKNKSQKGREDGLLYEKLLITLLSAKGFERFKIENAERNLFGVGREVKIGERFKFDDVVFMYPGQSNPKSLIFVQSKHKESYCKINSQILSSPASSKSGLKKHFNLEKYFISYLKARENLKNTKSDMLKNGEIKYLVLFSNAVFDIEDLEKNGFRLKKASGDIIGLLNALKSEDHCHQLEELSDELQKKLEKLSDMHRLAKELAKYLLDKNFKNEIMKMGALIQHYLANLGIEVITVDHKNDFSTVNSSQKLDEEGENYFKGRFRDDFIDDEDEGPKQNLRNFIFEAIRDLEKSKKNASPEELKTFLRETEVKLPHSFGKKNGDEVALPKAADDVTDFLKCLVFIFNQPCAEDFGNYVNNITQDIVKTKSLLRQVFEELKSVGPGILQRIEKLIKIDKKAHHKEWWLLDEVIAEIIQEMVQQIDVLSMTTVITIVYENDIMKWGLFNKLGEITKTLHDFLQNKEKKVLYINTPETALSSVRLLQYFSEKEGYRAEDGRISVNLNDLASKAYHNKVAEIFRLKNNNLLTIQCTETNQIRVVEEFYKELHNIIKDKPDKQIILIMQKDKPNILRENFMPTGEYVLEIDDKIVIEDFEPKIDFDPLKQEVIVFPGQRKKISLSELIGNSDWTSYLKKSSKDEYGEGMIDASSLIPLLNGEEIIIGSEPPRISSLEGAYAKLFEEINKETFRDRLFNHMSNDLFIISGINGSDEEKINKLIHYLDIEHRRREIENKVGNIQSGLKIIQIEDDQFKDEQFVRLCKTYPGKKIFWIIMKNENFVKGKCNGKCENHPESKNKVKFILYQFYNPDFYINRKFIDKVFITKGVKSQLTNHDLSERFILSGFTDQEEFVKLFEFYDEKEEQQLRNNCRNGKIRLANNEFEAENHYKILSKQQGVEMVHWLTFEKNRIVWCNSCGSLENLREYIDERQRKESLTEENTLIKEIKDKKTVIIADDPGMGKSTTLTKLYESRNESESILESHWVIRINLRDHFQAIKDIDSENIDVNIVISFLSKLDLNLNHCLAKNLLRIAINEKENSTIALSKPLLLAFDGFDELLDEEDRNKIISLLKFLSKESGVKFWITTRHHFKLVLEDALATFAIEFHPIEEEKTQFIAKYLKDRMSLILSKGSFEKVFGSKNTSDDARKIKEYANAFSSNMQTVFQDTSRYSRSTSKFLGTPLQLYLMLEGSISFVKVWIENYGSQPPSFDYLGKNIWEVYEKFIERKYEIYFKKTDMKEQLRQKQDKKYFNQYHKDLALTSILKTEHKKSFIEFKDIVLSMGIVKSQGSIFEFIHPTFGEYFAAELFVDWIKKSPHIFQNSKKQEFLIKTVFMEPSYELIRKFMNIKLKEEIMAGRIPEENLRQYGEIISKLWSLTRTSEEIQQRTILHTTIQQGTILHTAMLENKDQIIKFFFNCLEKTINPQKRIADFLSFKRLSGESAFDLAIFYGSDEIFELIIHKIDENLYENEFQGFLRNHKECMFTQSVSRVFKERILMLLHLVESKLSETDLCEFLGQTELHRAVIENNEDKFNSILHSNFRKNYLFHMDKFKNTVLHYSVAGNKYNFTKQILKKAKEISSEEEFKSFLCERDHEDNTIFDIAVNNSNFEMTKLILEATKCLHNSTGKCKLLRDLNDDSQDPKNKNILLNTLIPRTRKDYFGKLDVHDDIHTYLSHLYGRKERESWKQQVKKTLNNPQITLPLAFILMINV